MLAITISELIPSSISEIGVDEMRSIKGGMTSRFNNRERLITVPGLEAVNVFIPDEQVLNNLDSFSFAELKSFFDFIPLTSADELPSSTSVPIRRRGIF